MQIHFQSTAFTVPTRDGQKPTTPTENQANKNVSVLLPPPSAAYEVRTKSGSHQAPKSVIEGLALILRTRNGFGVRRVVSPSRNAEKFFLGGGT